MPVNRAAHWCPPGFSSQRYHATSLKCTPSRGAVYNQGILRLCWPFLVSLPSLLTGAPPNPPGRTLEMVWTSKTLDSTLHSYQYLRWSTPLLFPVNGFGEGFLLWNSLQAPSTFSLSVLHTLSQLSPLSMIKALSLCNTHISFVLRSTLCSFYLSWCGHFSTSTSAILLSQSPDQFLVYSKVIWYSSSCVRGMRQAQSPPTIFTS